MEIIDVLGRPCPIPVIEAKKALAKPGADGTTVKVDNIVAVQNLEKMAKGYGYGFLFNEMAPNVYDVTITLDGNKQPVVNAAAINEPLTCDCATAGRPVVVIGKNAMGDGSKDLGEILIKGFIYALTEQAVQPSAVIFLNSGAYLTAEGANTIPDIKKLENQGTKILTCGTCANYFGLTDKIVVGKITDMYGITQEMMTGTQVINI